MTQQCNYIIQKGPRAGIQCPNACKINDRCFSHSDTRIWAIEHENLCKQRTRIQSKLESILEKEKIQRDKIKTELSTVRKKINGIQIFLEEGGNPTIRYIPFHGKLRTHAKESLRVLTNRKQQYKEKLAITNTQIDKLDRMIAILQED